MADWTANSGFGATRDRGKVRRAEPVLRSTRAGAEAAQPERLAATRSWEDAAAEEPRRATAAEPRASGPRLAPGAAALAQYNAALEGPLAKARLAVWAGGGALSLLLIAGVGIWGYKLVLREVMGLPVIAAEAGPMRVAPADPGGEVVPQQGFAVNAIPGAGTAAPPSDVLMLAPQTRGLAEEDMQVVQTNAEKGEVMPVASEIAADPLGMIPAASVAAPEAPTGTVAPAPGSAVAALAAAATTAMDPAATPADQAQQAARLVASLLPADRSMTAEEILALADQVAAGSKPLTPLAPASPVQEVALAGSAPAAAVTEPAAPATPAPAAEAAATTLDPAATAAVATTPVEPAPAVAALAVIASTVPGPSAAPVPPARPATLRLASASVPSAAAAAAAPVPAEAAPVAAAPAPTPAAAPVAAGTHLVQLGAFDSAEIAASEWARLQAAHPEFLGGREHVIQETQSGGATLYRLRTLGFPERADARILCAALTAEGTDCIPVTVD